MKEIRGQAMLTAAVSADDVLKIDYVTDINVDIKNGTDGDIYISGENDFTEIDGVGNYIIIEAGGYYNNLSLPFSDVYIKSDGSGSITIVRCG